MTFLTWAQFKTQITDKGLMRFLDRDVFYQVWFKDFFTTIDKDSGADQTEFETSYLPHLNKVPVSSVSPFANKFVPGYKLYYRVHGQTQALTPNGDTTIDFVVPYALCKITEFMCCWMPEGITGDFSVVHPTYGQLSQHAFAVPLPQGFFRFASSYDATLQQGLILRLVLHNSTAETKLVGVTWVLHEMVAI